ncbi:MAG TPA: MFS transporter [Methylomirabilota bacterium]|nr:MFS transporter [Methylomirabilota bacterium]
MTPPARRAVVSWLLYDFANSAYVAVIPATVYAKYYALVVVGNERGAGDFWWGLAVTISMVIVALASPPLGAIADYAGLRKRFLGVLTYLSVGATALMATVDPGEAVWGLILAVLGTVGFEAAVVYYNAYLPDLADETRRGRLSAYGYATGYAGSALALGAALPFALSERYGGAFLVAAALFGLFALPALLYLPADRPGAMTLAQAVRIGFSQTRATLGRLRTLPDLRGFLLAYLFFEDGINTVVYFSSVFAGHTLGFSTAQVIGLYFVVQLSALAGAWLWARPIDTWGPRRVVMVTLVQWCVVVISAYFVTTKGQFYVVAILAGTGLGAVQAAARAFMASLIPRGQEAELFGFYSLCGKTAAVMGPVIFGTVSLLTGGNQRAAILAVGLMFIVGLVLLSRVRAGGPSARALA